MPNEINPNNYNIDHFQTSVIGITTANDFREYLLNKNLTTLPDELVNGAAGNFTSKFAEKGVEKSINYTNITNPGDIDEWFVGSNFSVTVHEIRDINLLKGNKYGPLKIVNYSYGEDIDIDGSTGFVEYATSAGGDDYTQILLNDKLVGLGPGAAINFPSKLNEEAIKRREEEAKNRLKLKGENLVLGTLNLDPFSLLAGADLVTKDYKITTNPTLIGKLFNTFTDVADVTIPTSPIPSGAFGKYGDVDGPEAYKDIMDSTGANTKSLIYKSVSVNKYGPTLNTEKGLLANVFGAGQAAQKNTYLTPPSEIINTGQLEIPLVDKINNAVGKAIDAITKLQIDGGDEASAPTEFNNPTIDLDDIEKNAVAGFDTLPSLLGVDTWAIKGLADRLNLPGVELSITPTDSSDGPIGTKIPIAVVQGEFYPGNAAPNGSKNDSKSYDMGMYWGSHNTNPFRKGILKYTQDLINNSKNARDYKDKARFIGAANDSENFDAKTGRHKNYSMGSTVTDEANSYYCRSWSVRNPYRKVSDLIRHGGGTDETGVLRSLTRDDSNFSVLGTNGFVKIAPYVTDTHGNFTDGVLMLGNPAVQKYMLSIENLAWQNTEQILHTAPCEIGPNGGRIMWFPPYNINFTDNSSVDWEATKFIGRGEPIYTYNSTERTGTLSFTLIIDHSMAMTEIKKKGEQTLYRYFAGCEFPIEEFAKIVPVADVEEVKTQIVEEVKKEEPVAKTEEVVVPPKEEKFVVQTPPSPPIGPQFYFRNALHFEKDKIGTNLETELSANADEKKPNYPANREKLWPYGYLRTPIVEVPPTIVLNPGFEEGLIEPITIPNPEYTGITQTPLDSLNELAIKRMNNLIEFLLTPEGKRHKIRIIGRTSDAGPESGKKSNEKLAEVRAKSTYEYFYKKLLEAENALSEKTIKASNLGTEKTYPTETEWKGSNLRWETVSIGEAGAALSVTYDNGTGIKTESKDDNRTFGDSDTSVPAAVRDRSALIDVVYNPEIDDSIIGPSQTTTPTGEVTPAPTQSTTTTSETSNIDNISKTAVDDKKEPTPQAEDKQKLRQEELAKRLTEKAGRYLAWECSYFEEMKQETPFIYEGLKQKLEHFHPAFHSMTPEGFNARLTFLKQCTRQGPNVAVGEPSNLAFGKPPICVLRIGDFYHTKIVIDSVNLAFDPLQWDLNPEGIGVQPMLCNVDLNFKFIGGSSLGGPISQLQNAVSFNFFANTALYNPRVIKTSVGEYKVTRPDPITGKPVDVADTVRTYNEKDSTFEYGAFMSPLTSVKKAVKIPGSSSQVGTGVNQLGGSTSGNQDANNLAKQVAESGVQSKEAQQSEQLKANIQEQVAVNESISKGNDNKGVGDVNNPGNENKIIKGFDNKNKVYKVQNQQTLKPSKSITGADYDQIIVPAQATIFRSKNKDATGYHVIYIGSYKTVDKEYSSISSYKTVYSGIIKDNGVTTSCIAKTFNSERDRGNYENSYLLDTIKRVFCKGNKDRTYAELGIEG